MIDIQTIINEIPPKNFEVIINMRVDCSESARHPLHGGQLEDVTRADNAQRNEILATLHRLRAAIQWINQSGPGGGHINISFVDHPPVHNDDILATLTFEF